MVTALPYADRAAAGRVLAGLLGHLRGQRVVVLGLPRGGVPVAAEVAAALHAPLDVIVVRKLGFPGHDGLAMGAIGPGGVLVLNEEIARRATRDQVGEVVARESSEVARREKLFRGDRP